MLVCDLIVIHGNSIKNMHYIVVDDIEFQIHKLVYKVHFNSLYFIEIQQYQKLVMISKFSSEKKIIKSKSFNKMPNKTIIFVSSSNKCRIEE